MNEGPAILRAIIEEPHDDLHRLAYADWLEDHDQCDRAEFIRVQMEFHNSRCMFGKEGDSAYDGYCNNANCRHEMLNRRAVMLLHTGKISPEIQKTPEWEWLGSGLRAIYEAVWTQADCGLPDSDLFSWEFRRGFVHAVKCLMQNWLDHGESIRQQHPLEEVLITDKRPGNVRHRSGGSRRFVWFSYGPGDDHSGDPASIPAMLMGGKRRRNFNEKKEAMDWLSRACLDLFS